MADLPYTLLSAAMTIDGYLDDATGRRLLLSNEEDFDRVDAVRAGCDAVLVGAGTIRSDDPRLLVRSAARVAGRVASGLSPSPLRVVLTAGGDLDPGAALFTSGGSDRVIYCATPALGAARDRLAGLATVVDAGAPPDLARVAADLAGRGVRRLMVEGGSSVLTQFLTAGLADELHLVVAPFFVGDPAAPRLVTGGAFPWHRDRRARLAEVRQLGDVALLRYALSGRFAG